MRDFVREDRRELVFSFSLVDQTIVNANNATWYRERVNRGVVNDDKLKLSVVKIAVKNQLKN